MYNLFFLLDLHFILNERVIEFIFNEKVSKNYEKMAH